MTMHEGHRRRLRERFRLEGLENFQPHEVLELLLFYAHARGDVNPLAHQLLDTFGSLRGVLEAPVDQLMQVPGVGLETATLISLMVPMFRRYEMCLGEERKRIQNYREVKEHCCALLTGLRKERFYVICLSSQMQIVGQQLLAEGSLTEVMAHPRVIVETVLNHNAYAVILCHNHPGGSMQPSADDIAVTRKMEAILTQLSIALVDHVVVADGKAYSMMEHGDFTSNLLRIGGKSGLREDEQGDGLWL